MRSSPLPGGNPVFLLALPFYLPALLRIFLSGEVNAAGILSDVALGSLLLCLTLLMPRFVRVILLILWVAFQISAREMLAAMQRFPNWQDLHYLTDPTFLGNTGEGLHLASPVTAGLMLAALLLALLASATRINVRQEGSKIMAGFVIGGGLLLMHGVANRSDIDSAVAARFNALHWFIRDAVAMPFRGELATPLPPPTLYSHVEAGGARLLGDAKGRAKNVLIVTLEGVHGGYHPDIRKALNVTEDIPFMTALAAQTTHAMLVPDFVAHSHQTIRGLYALLCGDISKLSTDMPKAFQVIGHPRADLCLPAQLAKAGWSTHFLQGAGLAFMNKDRVMPAIGFQKVLGKEWFTARDDIPFLWGASDPAFFKGARKYIRQLQAKRKPWMLTLMTVGTHQPYGVTDEIAAQYPDRLTAAVAVLDKSVGEFLAAIKADGVLEDTLVIVTSDESHGARQADWISSWGLNIVFAPEQAQSPNRLPRMKQGTYGLMDMEASILDYFDLPIPDQIGGRSFFRDYANGRDIASYTGNVLRWQTADNTRYECTIMEGCRVCAGAGVLGKRPANCVRDDQDMERTLFRMAYALDHSLDAGGGERVMRFADGDIRNLPATLRNEWIDNVIGAQYLDFPKGSKVHVSIKLTAPRDNASDVQMKLTLRSWENEVGGIQYAPFPLLKPGESTALEFDFENEQRMQSFSFHLFGAGAKARIQIDEFTVTVTPEAS